MAPNPFYITPVLYLENVTLPDLAVDSPLSWFIRVRSRQRGDGPSQHSSNSFNNGNVTCRSCGIWRLIDVCMCGLRSLDREGSTGRTKVAMLAEGAQMQSAGTEASGEEFDIMKPIYVLKTVRSVCSVPASWC